MRMSNLGEGEAVGGQDGTVCIKFSSIFTRFRDIVAFVLQHDTFYRAMLAQSAVMRQ